jgi:acyl-CoA synthetase (AMP-forming)/AMP-acid ligase II
VDRTRDSSRRDLAAGQIAVRFGEPSLTYGELESKASRLAGGLLEAGIAPGDRVALFMPNCPELVIAYLACFTAGVIAVPLNTRYRAPEVAYALERSGAGTVIVHHDLLGEVGTPPERLWIVGDGDQGWRAALDAQPVQARAASGNAAAIILFTSGSTSRPKGVTHTHASMSHTVSTQARVQDLGPDDVNLITLAMCHVAGLFGQLLATLHTGGCCLLHSRYDPGAAALEIERSRVTRIQLLPAQLATLLDAAEADSRDLSSLRCAIVGGDALTLDQHDRFREVTGLEATEVCGMTECFNYSMNPPFAAKRLGSIGRPPPGTELRLESVAGGEPLAGEAGEVLVRSAGVMGGYWGDPGHTAAALRDGWLHTGDLARRDTDGWYWFVGRSKDVIIRGGSNVAPGEVEAVLHEHPAVIAAVVVGVPDKRLGQRIAAWVQPGAGAFTSAEQLDEFVRERIAAYKAPEWIWIEQTLPTTSVGKLDRHLLQQRAAQRTLTSHPGGGDDGPT